MRVIIIISGILLATLMCSPFRVITPATVTGQEGRTATSNAATDTSENGFSKAETSEIAGLRQVKDDYRAMVRKLAIQLRSIQGIKREDGFAIKQFPNDSDIRLTGAIISRRPDSNEFALPATVSRAEESMIYVAGEIRAVECGNLMLNRIADPGNIPNPIGGMMALPYRQGTPAFDALCKIGAPVCQEAITRIPLEQNAKKRVFLVGFVQTCLGDSLAKSKIQKLRDQIGRDQLQLDYISDAISQIEDGPCPDNLHVYYARRRDGH